jgi:hypothetical protein
LQLPDLIRFHERFAEKGLIVLLIAVDENLVTTEKYATLYSPPFPVLVDPARRVRRLVDGNPAVALPVDEKGDLDLPATILLDRDLRIIDIEKDGVRQNEKRLKALLRRLLDNDLPTE